MLKERILNKRVEIGIDCRVALAPKTGDRTYCLNLLRGLQKLDLDPARWRFHLLLDNEDRAGVLPQAEYFYPVVLNAPNSRFWTNVTLPVYALRAQLDLVHVQYLAPLVLNCPFVTTIHDTVWKTFPETFPKLHRMVMNAALPQTVRRAARVLCGTQAAANDIKKYLPIRRDKICVTPYAIDPVFFEPVSAEQIASVRARYDLGAAPYVLSVGVLQPRKNVPRLIEAFQNLKTRHPDWPHQLVIVGKQGWGEQSANQNQGALRGESAMTYTGYVADEDLPALYAGADCFAYPSLYEGFGLPLLEAMASGTAVLTSNRGAMSEVAGDAAVLVEPLSMASITQGLEQILASDAQRTALQNKGKKRAAQFDIEQLVLATQDVYRQLLRAG